MTAHLSICTMAQEPRRAWVFGDNLDTDALAPGQYMKLSLPELATHCLEGVRPEFASQVRPGDIVVAGRNFGSGSSREQAPQALLQLGIACLIAPSFAGLFYRNALNLGLPALVCAEATSIAQDDRLTWDAATGRIINYSQGRALQAAPIPMFLLEMLAAGGLMSHLETQLKSNREPSHD